MFGRGPRWQCCRGSWLLALVTATLVLLPRASGAGFDNSNQDAAGFPLLHASLDTLAMADTELRLVPGINGTLFLHTNSAFWTTAVNATATAPVNVTQSSSGLNVAGHAATQLQAVMDVSDMENLTLSLDISVLTNHTVDWSLALRLDDESTYYLVSNGTVEGLQHTTVSTALSLPETLANSTASATIVWLVQTASVNAELLLHNSTASAASTRANTERASSLASVRQLNTTAQPVTTPGNSIAHTGIASAEACAHVCERNATCTVATHDQDTGQCTLHSAPTMEWGASTGASTSVFARVIADSVATVNITHRHSSSVSRTDVSNAVQPIQLDVVDADPSATLHEVVLPIVLLASQPNGCDGVRVNVSVFDTAGTDYLSAHIADHAGTRVATGQLSSSTIPTVDEVDEENVLLAPNWWTTVPLFWTTPTTPSIANLNNTLLIALRTTETSACRAITFATTASTSVSQTAFRTTEDTALNATSAVFGGENTGATLALRVGFAHTGSQVLSTGEPQDDCLQFSSQAPCDSAQTCEWYACKPKLLDACQDITDQETCELTAACAFNYNDNTCFKRDDATCSLLSCSALTCDSFAGTCLPVAEAYTCRADVSSACTSHMGCSAAIDCISQQVAECGATEECLSVCPFYLLQSSYHAEEVEAYVTCLQSADSVDGGLLGALVNLVLDVLDLLLGDLLAGTLQTLAGVVTGTQHALVTNLSAIASAVLRIDVLGVAVSVLQRNLGLVGALLGPAGAALTCPAQVVGGIAWPETNDTLAVVPCPNAPGRLASRLCTTESAVSGFLGRISSTFGAQDTNATSAWLPADTSACSVNAESPFQLGILDSLQAALATAVNDTASALTVVADTAAVLDKVSGAFAVSVQDAIAGASGGSDLLDIARALQSSFAGVAARTLDLALHTLDAIATRGISIGGVDAAAVLEAVGSVLRLLDPLTSSAAAIVGDVIELSSAILDGLGTAVSDLLTALSVPLPLGNVLLSLGELAASAVGQTTLPSLLDLSTNSFLYRLYTTSQDIVAVTFTAVAPRPLYLQNTISVPAQLARLGTVSVFAVSPFGNVSLPEAVANTTSDGLVCAACSVPAADAAIVSDIVDVTLNSGRAFEWPVDGNGDARDLSVAFNMSYLMFPEAVAAQARAGTEASLRRAITPLTTLSQEELQQASLSVTLQLNAVKGPRVRVRVSAQHTAAATTSGGDGATEDAGVCKTTTTACEEDGGTGDALVTLVPVCHWWDPDAKVWDTSGCGTSVSDDGQHVLCTCSHTTSYAVLLKSDGAAILSSSHALALQLITFVGAGISLAGLILTAAIYARYWRSVFVKEHHRLVAVLAVVLALAQGALLLMLTLSPSLKSSQDTQANGGEEGEDASAPGPSSDSEGDGMGCVALALALHFLLVLSFAWMVVLGVNVYRSFVTVMDQRPISLVRALVACCVVAGAVAASTYAGAPSHYTSEEYCWVDMSTTSLYGFAVPLGVMLVVNTFLMGTSLRSIAKEAGARIQARAAMTFVWILGLTWVFGVLALLDAQTLAWQYLFTIFSVLQGVFIFANYVVASERLRDAMFTSSERSLSRRQATMAKVRAHDRSSDRPSSSSGSRSSPSQYRRHPPASAVSSASTVTTAAASRPSSRPSSRQSGASYLDIVSSENSNSRNSLDNGHLRTSNRKGSDAPPPLPLLSHQPRPPSNSGPPSSSGAGKTFHYPNTRMGAIMEDDAEEG